MVDLRNQNPLTPLPAQVDVVVVGGGIIGVTAAFFLAQQGISVALFDKGVVAGEQSSRNLGWCRTVGRDAAEMPLMLESLDLWRQANTILEAETGFRTTGLLYGYETEADVEARQDWLDVARAHQVETRLLEGKEVERLLPSAARRPKFVIHAPGNGGAEPAMATHAFANAAMRSGARSPAARCCFPAAPGRVPLASITALTFHNSRRFRR
jgi:glycine/D-amino acid oxidase-like deaminating enzyme